MDKEVISEIIDNFSNEELSNSSYSISSEGINDETLSFGDNSSNNTKINLLSNKRNDEFIFYNNEQSDENSESSDFNPTTIEQSFFNSTDLKNKKDDIIKLFNIFDTVIFTDDFRIKLVSRTGCFWFLKKKDKIDPADFPGILFLSFGAINLIKKIINKHNLKIIDSDSETISKRYNYQICFDDGDIYKNMVYKKIQIQNKLLFVPMNKYQLKLTEYKLRGFCQIMEELGAVEIEIEFNNAKLESASKGVEIRACEYNYIAGSLGFSATNSKSDSNEITYKLIYPKNNTFILNSKVIKKKIQVGKYIINKKNFDSNLELQYIIESRCRHFITNYSTVFTLDNSISYDHKLISKLKANNFNLGFETNYEAMKNLKLSINTKVKFCEQKEAYGNLLGDNVSWDSIGFNYLLGTLDEGTFENEGILKIIFFTHRYIDKVLYYKNKKYFYNIKRIYKIMNKEFSFDEYKTLLLSYFNVKSHWLHFLNFIDVLVFKSVSYDKLGFLVLMNQKDIPIYKKNQKILNFIKHISTNESIEDNFWEMLEPNNYYLAVNKLEKYDLLRKFNWFNLERLIYDIKKYKPKEKIDHELKYCELYNNFMLGHSNIQFEKNIKPYIVGKIHEIIQNDKKENIFIKLLYHIIYPRHLTFYNLNTDDKLVNFIHTKIKNLNEAQDFFEDIYDLIKNYGREDIMDISSNIYKQIFPIINCPHFTDKYPYISRKLISIMEGDINLKIFYNFCIKFNIYKNMENFCFNTITKIILFDSKIDEYSIEISNHGYKTLMEHIKINPYKNNSIVIFFVRLCKFIINQKLTDNTDQDFKIDDNIIENINSCYNYNKLVDIACEFLNRKFNLNLDNEFLLLLKN